MTLLTKGMGIVKNIITNIKDQWCSIPKKMVK